MWVFHKMGSSEEKELEYLTIDFDFVQIEKSLQQRRKVKLSIIIMIFVISIGVIIYSVIHDIRRRNGKMLSILKQTYSVFSFTGSIIHLETLVCSQTDLECLSLLCPVSMIYNSEEGRCEEDADQVVDVGLLGVVGNVKTMCREGFVWVEWKSQCLRKT